MLENKKGRLLIICLTIIMLLVVGCSDKKTDKNFTGDANQSNDNGDSTTIAMEQNPSLFNQGNHKIAEFDSGLFVLASDVLHYVDAETKEAVIFSNDTISPKEMANKIHEMMTPNVDIEIDHEAYFNYPNSIFYHNGKIYLMEMTGNPKALNQLIVIDPGTHQRDVLAEFKTQQTNFVIVDNKIFVVGTVIDMDQDTGDSTNLEVKETDKNNVISDNNDQDYDLENLEQSLNNSAMGIQEKYQLLCFDLIEQKMLDPIEIKVPDEYLDLNPLYYDFQSFGNNIYLRMGFFKNEIDPTNTDSFLITAGTFLNVYDVENSTFNNIEIEKNIESFNPLLTEQQGTEQQNEVGDEAGGEEDFESASIFDYTFLDDQMYITKRAKGGDNAHLRNGSVTKFFKADLLGQNMTEIENVDIDYKMISNGKDLYAVPAILRSSADNENFGVAPFVFYKYQNGTWQKQFDVDTSGIDPIEILAINKVSVTSKGDLLLYGEHDLYIVRDGVVQETINYGQYFKKNFTNFQKEF